jgi:hypothetical protein
LGAVGDLTTARASLDTNVYGQCQALTGIDSRSKLSQAAVRLMELIAVLGELTTWGRRLRELEVGQALSPGAGPAA